MNREIEINKNLAGRLEFIEGVKKNFPESLTEMYDLEDELLHIDMANFARTTEKTIISNDTDLVQKHFSFISDLFQKASPDLKNAILVSYLENVFFSRNEDVFLNARSLLPNNLAEALTELEEHFEKLHDSNRST